jgi:methylmalonyl-CoA mutase
MDLNESKDNLFNEFPPVTTAEWEEKIKADLKGADYEKKLIWKTEEGFSVKPYYRTEDLAGLEYLQSLPGEYPFVRGIKKGHNDWIIRQDINTDNLHDSNRIALHAIQCGAEAIGFCAREITTHKQMHQLLNGVDLTRTRIHFIASRSFPLTLELFLYEVSNRGLLPENIIGSLNFDPASFLLLHGDFYVSWENNIDEAVYLIKTIRKRLPGFRTITINGQYFSNAGSTLVQELAFSLASANEYLAALTSKGLEVDAITPLMLFSFGTGSAYFPEIAKLRAARLLWSTLVQQYHPVSPGAAKMFIHSSTSSWNKTVTDPYVNMLRTTTEGMSAAIGNADSISVLPFDKPFREPDDFSERIARNQQLILKEEAYLDKVADPSAGSYFIENLTHSIAFHAWELFKKVEEKGGMIECIKSGFIQDEISMSAQKKQQDLANRKAIMIGTNQYPDLTEKLPEALLNPEPSKGETASTYRKLNIYRGSEAFEKIRLATEAHVVKGNKRPSVFLFTIGNLAIRKARAMFTTNFFGCAGYEIADNDGFCSVEEGTAAALASGAEIIVLCSSDEEYKTIAVEAVTGLKRQKPGAIVMVAGYPKENIESLMEAGVDDFIHIRSNLLETLQKYQKVLIEDRK